MTGNMNITKIKKVITDGVLFNNPTFVQLLGTCPTLATTSSVINGIGMGLSTTMVLIFSNLFISLLRKIISKQVRIAAYIVLIAGFVSALEMLLKAYVPFLDQSLGIFIPLIVVNCIILARAEAFASKNSPILSALDGLSMGLGFTLALFLISSVREIAGMGTFLGYNILGKSFEGAMMFIMPPGAFLTMGCIIAAVKKLMKGKR
ncbi:MAG: electron transport complex subunit RsxE [Eubacteriales bacterium]